MLPAQPCYLLQLRMWGLAVAREEQRALAVRRPRDERAVARQWKRGSEGMPMFDDALVSDHAHGRGLFVPFAPMPWFNKMNVFFGESLSVGADSVEMKLAREFFYGSEHHKSLTVEAEERRIARASTPSTLAIRIRILCHRARPTLCARGYHREPPS